MTPLEFERRPPSDRLGLKGPRAQDWLAACGIDTPAAPNTWLGFAGDRALAGAAEDGLLVARLGAGEFFLEDAEAGVIVRALTAVALASPAGVYPVLREDAAFRLAGDGALDVLAQVCNVDFATLALEPRPVVMTLMIGVSVLVLPQAKDGRRRFQIWCDPTFGEYLGESVGSVVVDCGGHYRR
jgi:sarcosine oxidase subunit gamma